MIVKWIENASARVFELLHDSLNRSVPASLGLVRIFRGLVYAVLVAGVAYGLNHLAELNLTGSSQTLVLVLLLGMDKYLREHKREFDPESEDN